MINVGCFVVMRLLADAFHADRSLAFMLGWIALAVAEFIKLCYSQQHGACGE
jgi:hypothetical protein